MKKQMAESNAIITVRVHPRAHRTEVSGVTGDVVQVKITAPPVDNKANLELVQLLSRLLSVSKSSITVIRGHTSRTKLVSIEGLSQPEAMSRLSSGSSSGSASKQ